MKAANDSFNISIIIPAFNEEDKIKNCLKSISDQRYKNIEIILVDDRSTDKTTMIVEEIAASLGLNLRVVKLKVHKERGIARNVGARRSTGRYLLFIDADMKISKNVIAECRDSVNRNLDIKGIIIPEESEGMGFWAKCRKLEKKCYLGDERIEAARFFEKRAFWSVGGWDNKMISGEDWDLTRRVRSKYKISRVKSFIYHHEYKLTLWKAIKKKFYYGSVSGIYLERNPLSILGLIYFVFRPAYIRNWKLIVSDPIHGAGMLFLKTIELFAGVAGYLFSKRPNLR